jgi:hypothetical protein
MILNSSGIEIEPSNKSLWSSLRLAEEAQESDRTARHAAAAIERAQEDHRKHLRENSKNRPVAQTEKPAPINNPADDLNDFFASVTEIKPAAPAVFSASHAVYAESVDVSTVPVAPTAPAPGIWRTRDYY